ncbi:MAG: DUF5658 family protein [Bryobacteraceae bacterium]|jgi:hypothetical protein
MLQELRGEILTVQIFLYLQLLDFLTTLLGFRLGASEASPFIRTLLYFGPALGVALSKGVALALGAFCVWRKKTRIIGWINYWYAGLIVWNLCVILRALMASQAIR